MSTEQSYKTIAAATISEVHKYERA